MSLSIKNSFPYSMATKLRKSEDPYQYLLLQILRQAFSDIHCYYTKSGTPLEQREGKKSMWWIMQNDGIFPLICRSVEIQPWEIPHMKFRKMCVDKVLLMKQHKDETIQIL